MDKTGATVGAQQDRYRRGCLTRDGTNLDTVCCCSILVGREWAGDPAHLVIHKCGLSADRVIAHDSVGRLRRRTVGRPGLAQRALEVLRFRTDLISMLIVVCSSKSKGQYVCGSELDARGLLSVRQQGMHIFCVNTG